MAYLALAVSAVLVVIDQVIKWLVTTNMELYDSIPVWKIGDTEILNFSYYLNDGAAFSILEGKRWFLVAITSIAIIIGIVALLMKKVKKKRYIWSIAVIIGGGIGNLIDRIFNNGMVVDFIDVTVIKFAVFNFADICATGGAIALLVFVIWDEISEIVNRKKNDKDGKSMLSDDEIDEEDENLPRDSEKTENSDGENTNGAL